LAFGRAIAEPFVINMHDPASYRDDWGGPSLAGVLIVHCSLGLLSLASFVAAFKRRLQRRRASPGRSIRANASH